MTTERETEVKICIENPGRLRKDLLSHEFTCHRKRYFEYNIVFDTVERKLFHSGLLLRLRSMNSDRAVLTFKRSLSGQNSRSFYKVAEETEVAISDFLNMKDILLATGFTVFFVYEKYREVFKKKDIFVCIDQTPVGDFLEIEGTEAVIDQTAGLLGFSRRDYITDTYHTLARKAGFQENMVFE